MCWPVLRLVMQGHDYELIKSTWTLPMVLKVNRAIDIQEQANRQAQERANEQVKPKNPFGG